MQAGITQDSTLNKLILLFVLDKMETALTEATILDLCSYKNNLTEIQFCLAGYSYQFFFLRTVITDIINRNSLVSEFTKRNI